MSRTKILIIQLLVVYILLFISNAVITFMPYSDLDDREKNYMFFPAHVDMYPYIAKIFKQTKFAPLGSIPMVEKYLCNEGYGAIRFTPDRYGFRNNDNYWNRYNDVVLVGDSFTHGQCVEENDSIAGILENSFNVINLGISGNQPLQYGASAKTFVPFIKPKFLVTIFCNNDFDEQDERYHYFNAYFKEKKHHYILEAGSKEYLTQDGKKFYELLEPAIQNYSKERHLHPNNDTERYSFLGFFTLRILAKKIHTITSDFFTSINEKNKNENKEKINFKSNEKINPKPNEIPFSSKLAINTLVEVCSENDCNNIIVYIPAHQIKAPDQKSIAYAKLLKKYALSLGIPFIDMQDFFINDRNDSMYAPHGPHLSKEGYRLVAEKIRLKINEIKKDL